MIVKEIYVKIVKNEKDRIFQKPNITCNICKSNLDKNINNYIIHCPFCQNAFCDKCSLKHIKDYPNHNLYYNKYIFYENVEDKNDNEKEFNLSKNNPCSICKKIVKPINNNQFIYCNKCQGNLCENCEPNHNVLFPGHDFIINKYIVNILPNKNRLENIKGYDNDNIDNINLIKNDRCLICYDNIPIINNGMVIYCNYCPGSLCNSCLRDHIKKYPEHKTIELKTQLIGDKNNDELKNQKPVNICGECGNNINMNCIFYCNSCNNNLCNKCGNSHIQNKKGHEIIFVKTLFENNKNNKFNILNEDKINNYIN